GHSLLPALLRVVRPGHRGAVRVARPAVARDVPRRADRGRAHRGIGRALWVSGTLRGPGPHREHGERGAREDVPGRARGNRRRPALRQRLRGTGLGGAPRAARRTSCRQAHSGRRGRPAQRRIPPMSPLAAAFLTVHTPRYCTLEAAYEGKLASEVFRPVRDGLVAQGEKVAQARLDVTVINSCHLITTFPTVVDGTPRHQGVLTAQEAPEIIHGVPYDYPGA